jgi:hypothetical protein
LNRWKKLNTACRTHDMNRLPDYFAWHQIEAELPHLSTNKKIPDPPTHFSHKVTQGTQRKKQ